MSYWEDKIKAFLHDPPTKALNIKGHKETTKRFLDTWYISSGGDEIYDQISASADRPGVPGHDDGCSVDFKEYPEITHPISKGRLKLNLPNLNVSSIEDNAIKLLSEMTLNEYDADKSKYFALIEGIKQKLSKDMPPLYSVWNKIPADTRVPDHSIWHHNSLVSALSSCKNEAYFFIFSLGPVQGFISEARKLRDLWAGSMILSYLSWVGIRVICDEFGPDHIVYPSLSGQPLFYGWLKGTILTEIYEKLDEKALKVASFPNKFVAILPKDSIENTAQKIKSSIIGDWNKLSNSVYEIVKLHAGANPQYFEQIWRRQNMNLWEFYWSASPWLKTFQDTLMEEFSNNDIEKLKKLSELFEKSSGYQQNQGILYQSSHELAQSILAASKNSRGFHENFSEPGDKCTQCGKRQQLSTSENRQITKEFWKKIREKNEQEIKEFERLCSTCLVKRLIYINRNLLPSQLKSIFENLKFPSSTEMAFNPIIRRLDANGKIEIWNEFVKQCGGHEEKAYDLLHDNDEISNPNSEVKNFLKRLEDEANIKVSNIFGKYYAILMMDGDKMGDLVNGKADKLASWEDIMHSSLPEKMRLSSSKDKTTGWLEKNRLCNKRHLTPSVHKAISESLGDFSLNTVPDVINKHNGHLIYAGGDDLLAVLPVDTVLVAAQEIRELYRLPFVVRKANGDIEKCGDEYTPQKGDKLLMHLGEASTISAAIIFAHHKEPLRSLIIEVHNILDSEAKEKAGRDAVAISLRKRSGAEKVISQKWDSVNGKFINNMKEVIKFLSEEKIASKLIYKIEENKTAIEMLNENAPAGSVEKFIESLIEKGQRDKDKKNEEFKQIKRDRAKQVSAVMQIDNGRLNTDGLMIARFLAQCIGGD